MAVHSSLTAACPKLRLVDIRPHAHNGESYLMLRDPLQLSEQQLLIPQPLGAVLALCDGTRTPHDVAQTLSLYWGATVPTVLVEQVVEALDAVYLLENERMAEALRRARAAYRQAPCRPPLLAGQSYPAEPDALHALLEGYLAEARRSRNGAGHQHKTVAGLLSPHIDYPRGGSVYAQVWEQAAAAAQTADLVVIFGTDHYGGDPFTLTRQSYSTPYGVLPTALDVVDRLAAVLGEEAAYAGELRHRGEHSLELVAVWLHHLRARRPVEIVPILVGGFHHHIAGGTAPANDGMLNRVLETLADATRGRRLLVVASGDLAHVGPAFGGEPLDAAARAAVAAADKELLQWMQQGDAEGFFEAIRRVRDRNNVCGVAPIYLTLRLLGKLGGEVRGELAGYASCNADARETSAVTVGGMVFHPA